MTMTAHSSRSPAIAKGVPCTTLSRHPSQVLLKLWLLSQHYCLPFSFVVLTVIILPYTAKLMVTTSASKWSTRGKCVINFNYLSKGLRVFSFNKDKRTGNNFWNAQTHNPSTWIKPHYAFFGVQLSQCGESWMKADNNIIIEMIILIIYYYYKKYKYYYLLQDHSSCHSSGGLIIFHSSFLLLLLFLLLFDRIIL